MLLFLRTQSGVVVRAEKCTKTSSENEVLFERLEFCSRAFRGDIAGGGAVLGGSFYNSLKGIEESSL